MPETGSSDCSFKSKIKLNAPKEQNTRVPNSTAPSKLLSTLSGTNKNSSFSQGRQDILKRLQNYTELCRENYSRRKELASEIDGNVMELVEALEDAFSYGLRQQQGSAAVTAASLLQNMQEIVTGSIGSTSGEGGEFTFWDFCSKHLTPHEIDRYENLKHVWTKQGRGRSFLRATLNENSLQRYFLTWLSSTEELHRYYTQWSLLIDSEASRALQAIIANLQEILFALNVDTTELNSHTRTSAKGALIVKEEPIIYAPSPVPVVNGRPKRKVNAVERPIITAGSTENILNTFKVENSNQETQVVTATVESVAEEEVLAQRDPIKPELEFLEEPLPDFYPSSISVDVYTSSNIPESEAQQDFEVRSDTSSLCSKSSSLANSANDTINQQALELRLQEMSERCALLETRVAQLSLENRQLVRRLTKFFNEAGIDPTSSLTPNFLITIPQVKLLKTKRGSAYHTYEVHITMRQQLEHWTVWRRYSEFYNLHKSLLRTHPIVSSVQFPPKKHFGNKDIVFVEERRQQLQIYLLNIVETLPQVEACKTKVELQKGFPFVREG